MKTAPRLTITALVLAAFNFSTLTTTAQVVEIPDAGLRIAIRVALSRPIGDITVTDMESLTELDASRGARGWTAPLICSLEGLQTARNLTELELKGVELWDKLCNVAVSDLSPLAGLTGLSRLDLWGNRLTNLTLRAGLANLSTLNLGENRLTDFAFLSGLTNLSTLILNNNELTNLTIPFGPTGLTALDLSANQLANLTLPDVLTELSTLNLGDNRLSDLAFLRGLANLTSLDLNWNRLTSLTLAGLRHRLQPGTYRGTHLTCT